nr:hypothetical protein [Tanacetum cinerariifolium]
MHHLPLEDERGFNNALLLYIRRNVIKNRVEDLQLEVESYQRTINHTKLKLCFEGINEKIPLKGCEWNDKDIKKSKEMVNKIDQVMKHREKLRRLEEYVDDTMNEDTPVGVASAVKEGVTPFVVDLMMEKDKLSSLDDNTVSEPFLPLSTSVITDGNAPGKSSYANITGKPSGKRVNVHTLFTPKGNGIDVAYPVVANYVRNTWGKYVTTQVLGNQGGRQQWRRGPSDIPLCYLCTYEHCGNILIDGACLKCNSGARNSFTFDPIPESFNEVQSISNPPPQSHFKIYLCQLCESNPHYGYECSQRVPLVYEPKPCYNQNFGDNAYPQDSPGYSVNPSLNIQNEPDAHELFISKLIQQKLQNEYAQPFSAIAITLYLPTVEPEDYLRLGDEHLDTISETESDEFINSSVKNLVPSPSESEDLSDSECDVPVCDNFKTFSNLLFDANDDFSSSNNESIFDEDISKKIYSNPLFDEEIISMKIDPYHFNAESDLIESLINHDSLIISSSSKFDSLLDEFAGELILLKSITPGIDETYCDPGEEIRLIEKLLYNNSSPRPPEEFISENFDFSIESFSPSPIPVEDSDSLMKEIDLSSTPDDSMPSGIEEDDYYSERDILILEGLLSNDSLSLPENK